MDKKNRFSTLLKQLMAVADLKNYMLATYLQYDVSYISKWISGQMLPAEKMKVSVLQKISHCVVTTVDQEKLEMLQKEYQVETPQELENAIYDHLSEIYRSRQGTVFRRKRYFIRKRLCQNIFPKWGTRFCGG